MDLLTASILYAVAIAAVILDQKSAPKNGLKSDQTRKYKSACRLGSNKGSKSAGNIWKS